MNSNGRPARLVIGTVMLIASLALIACSGYLLISHTHTAEVARQLSEVSSCKSFLLQSGASVKTLPSGLQAVWETETQTESKVMRAATSISECSMFELKQFCAGTECSKPGVTLQLSSGIK